MSTEGADHAHQPPPRQQHARRGRDSRGGNGVKFLIRLVSGLVIISAPWSPAPNRCSFSPASSRRLPRARTCAPPSPRQIRSNKTWAPTGGGRSPSGKARTFLISRGRFGPVSPKRKRISGSSKTSPYGRSRIQSGGCYAISGGLQKTRRTAASASSICTEAPGIT